jgi:hypothetical protein
MWAASEAQVLGRGGITLVSRATGIARQTIRSGIEELKAEADRSERGQDEPRVRRVGGGRKRLTHHDKTLLDDLMKLVDPATRGDPVSPLRWTSKSTRKLAEELASKGHFIGSDTVGELLRGAGYSLQSNSKTTEGKSQHPDRNAQFEFISAKTQAFQRLAQPVISVDTKKKELIGDFKNGGKEWQPAGSPEKVRVHDFIDPALGKVAPYGVYDITANEGWVSVGTDHDTPAFAVETIRRWWLKMGSKSYRKARSLLVCADGGGSNSSRARLWKTKLQELANETRLRISVCHFPPGTSKWNKIEHRMFCHITENWRGRPLRDHAVVVSLIANTTTRQGLRIRAAMDKSRYETGIKITDAELDTVNLSRDPFHGEWNYTISPA